MKKNMKGISLIVLIVTIIVMIIIAGAIIISLSNTNIIDRAESATSDYNLKVEKEKIQLALNEWLLEKSTSANSKTFKAFMTEALPDDTVSGLDAGPIIIEMKGTKNKYDVTSNGNITLKNESGAQPTELEKYFFGEDLLGRDFMSLLSESEESAMGMDFIDDISTEINERDALEVVGTQNGDEIEIIKETETETMTAGYYIITDSSDPNNVIIYNLWLIHYINSETGEEWLKTYPEYGLVKAGETSQFEGTNVGKIVSYDDKLWTIMYDDETNGLQMVCNQSQLYNGEEFKLGYTTSTVMDWNTVLDEADLDKNGELTNFEKSAYGYNNAIDILNAACESVVTPNANILDVRSIGSNPVNKNSENKTLYTSDLLATLPAHSDQYPVGTANSKLKGADENYITDMDRILYIHLLGLYNTSELFYNNGEKDRPIIMASRIIREDGDEDVNFEIGRVTIDMNYGYNSVVVVRDYDIEYNHAYGTLLPVVKLNPNVEFTGAGTVDSPYTF